MKLLRHGEKGRERPGVLDSEGRIRDLSAHIEDIDGAALRPEVLQRLARIPSGELPLLAGTARVGPCVANPGKIVCIGLNYTDHAREAGLALPPEPIIFMKATSALSGPDDAIELPRGAAKGDWEAELGVVIGSRAKYVSEAAALEHVAGYCIVNDVSERALQFDHQGQWTKGKSHDSFAPVGPWLVTRDEIPDPQNLAITLEVNGRRYQDGSTATMVFPVRALVAYVSRFMTLLPGDLIATGTPAGVGMGQKPPVFLKPGDEVRVAIAGLGVQQQRVVASPEAAEGSS
ncbi:MAG: fumarylacetoacetate hydrolase family protein [Gammaproteobacteria bacterium]|nr:fumarylacetoacetate hydrolase family protein [Gammaproteobacteria bacterium]